MAPLPVGGGRVEGSGWVARGGSRVQGSGWAASLWVGGDDADNY